MINSVIFHIKWFLAFILPIALIHNTQVPSIEWDYTTKRVLTMEYCPGGQVNDAAYMKKHRIDVSKVSN